MSSLARRRTSVISASMDLGAGEEPGGWPRPGLRVEEEVKGEREESRVACRRRDSFMASLSRSLDLMKGHRIRTYHIIVLFLFFVFLMHCCYLVKQGGRFPPAHGYGF